VVDFHKVMKMKQKEMQAKYPDLALCWLDKKPEALQSSMMLQGWKPLKGGEGAAGEIRVGDLILAGRPKEVHEKDKKELQTRTRKALDATKQTFERRINTDGAGGRFLKPLSESEMRGKFSE
jgi:hypothetical protein